MSDSVQPQLSQIAMSVTDLRRTHQWYRDVFGFVPGGGTEIFKGWLTEKVQGVPGANNTCWWLLDKQDFFQLEFFQFHRPKPKPIPDDWRPCDVGYTMLGIHVEDFDAALDRARRFGSAPLTEPLGVPGGRRVCIRDPEGVLLEVMEDDVAPVSTHSIVRTSVPAAVRVLTASVPDLDASLAFFRDGLQFKEERELSLHTIEHEALWGLEGAQRKTALLRAGEILLELVQYESPAGKLRPEGYLVSDQGLLNFALGFRTRRDMRSFLKRARSAGASPNWIILDTGVFAVVYVNDPQGFSVELLCVSETFQKRLGFTEWHRDTEVHVETTINAPRPVVWERFVDHARMGEWMGVRSELAREGEDVNGPGAERVIRAMGLTLVEEITDWEKGTRLDYRLRSGVPMKYHLGRVTFEDADGGTVLRWTIRFQGKAPGIAPLLKATLRNGLRKGLQTLKSELESS